MSSREVTILDDEDHPASPPTPISMMPKWRVFAPSRLHHCFGGMGVNVPFYSVQDCGFAKSVCKNNKVFISKRNDENTVCFFTFIVWVSCLCTLTLFTLSAEMQVDFALFKFFETVYNSEFILFETDERKTCIVSNVMLFKR